jgi:colicin import membrane protein
MSYAGHYSLLSGHLAEASEQVDARFKRVLATSLVVHAVLLLGLMSLRFSPTIEQPLASYRVSLVTLPEFPVPASSKEPTPVKKAKVLPVAKSQKVDPVLPPVAEPVRTEQVMPSIVDALEEVTVPQSRGMTPVAKASDLAPTQAEPARKTIDHQSISMPVVPQAPKLSAQQSSNLEDAPNLAIPSSGSLADTLKQAVQSVAVPQKPETQQAQIPAPQAPKSDMVASAGSSSKLEPQQKVSPRPRVADSLKQVMQSVVVPEMKKSAVTQQKNVQAVPVPSPSSQESRMPPRKELEGIVMPSKAPTLAAVDRSKIKASLKEASGEVLPKPDQQNAVNQKIAKLIIPDVQAPESHHILSKPLESGIQSTTTTLQVSGSSPEGHPYWGRVWSKIDREWVAPTVDVSSGNPLRVVLVFRIERNGAVKKLAINQSSGNEYYDVAAKRAVLDAAPLPSFPSDMRDAYYDVQFQFTVNMDSK